MATTTGASSPTKSTSSLDLDSLLSPFLSSLSKGHTQGSHRLAQSSLWTVRRIVADYAWKDAEDLMQVLRRRLGPKGLAQSASATAAAESIVGNIVRRALKIIREDLDSEILQNITNDDDDQHADSLHKMVADEAASSSSVTAGTVVSGSTVQHGSGGGAGGDIMAVDRDNLRSKILSSLDELESELDSALEEISCQAMEHIHASEIILTVGRSKTVEAFLKQAAKARQFHVMVAECAPFYHGHEMAVNLAKAKIKATVVTDSAVFAVMARVNKVIIGAAAILADGGLKAVAGGYTAALAAKHFSVPLYVCASMFKLTPQFFCKDQEAFNRFVSPQETMRGMDGAILAKVGGSSVTPVFEYVPPELVTLFISNVSGYAPSYVYRLLMELYHPKDYDLNAD